MTCSRLDATWSMKMPPMKDEEYLKLVRVSVDDFFEYDEDNEILKLDETNR